MRGVLVAIGNPDRATLRRQEAGDGLADAGATAGDECDATFEVEVHLVASRFERQPPSGCRPCLMSTDMSLRCRGVIAYDRQRANYADDKT